MKKLGLIVGLSIICICQFIYICQISKPKDSILTGIYIGEIDTLIDEYEKLLKSYRNLEEEFDLVYQKYINLKHKMSLQVYATAYSPSKQQCNNDNGHTSLMHKPIPGSHIAVSQDLVWMLGKKVYIKGIGVKLVSDLMNKRYTNRIDIMFGTRKQALKFHNRTVEMVVID